MLSLAFLFAALFVAQLALIVPVADFMTRKLSGERPVSPRGIPATVRLRSAA
jgi:hypothetical protein